MRIEVSASSNGNHDFMHIFRFTGIEFCNGGITGSLGLVDVIQYGAEIVGKNSFGSETLGLIRALTGPGATDRQILDIVFIDYYLPISRAFWIILFSDLMAVIFAS